jgi:hypothetical protein
MFFLICETSRKQSKIKGNKTKQKNQGHKSKRGPHREVEEEKGGG